MFITTLSPHLDLRRRELSSSHSVALPTSETARAALAQRKTFRRVLVPYRALLESQSDATGLSDELSMGDLHAYVPSSPDNEELHIFFPGSGALCKEYTSFLEEMANYMYTICLPYDNRLTVRLQCLISPTGCQLERRLLAFNGSVGGVEGNNHVARLVKVLKYLADKDSGAWSKYLQSGKPAWSSMRLSGHSQGAGAVAMIAFQEVVSRVVQFAGPCDDELWVRDLAPSKTPHSRFYSVAHHDDKICGQVAQDSWLAEGIPAPVDMHSNNASEVAASIAKHEVQAAVSHIKCEPPACKQTRFPPGKQEHDGIISLGAEGTEPYGILWHALMGL